MSVRYYIPDPLPWPQIANPLAVAEDALARLDQRLVHSPIQEGWAARTHFTDACASLWLAGELVHLEDLVLHDAGMDIRTPTHELTRARAVLQTRRRIAGAKPDWAMSPAGLTSLRGRRGQREGRGVGPDDDSDDDASNEYEYEAADGDRLDPADVDEDLAGTFAAVDAAMGRAKHTLGRTTAPRRDPDALVYDLDWDENTRIADWQRVVDDAGSLPPTLQAAIAADAWEQVEPLQHMPWLGRLLGAALLRHRRKATSHLPSLNTGLKAIARERRRLPDPASRLVVQLDAITAAADSGRKDHDRWAAARTLLQRKLTGRRTTSSLPALIDLVMSRPIVSAGMIAAALAITPRAAQNLVTDLGLREATGRARYRAWGVL